MFDKQLTFTFKRTKSWPLTKQPHNSQHSNRCRDQKCSRKPMKHLAHWFHKYKQDSQDNHRRCHHNDRL
jgi:hypothetical protein